MSDEINGEEMFLGQQHRQAEDHPTLTGCPHKDHPQGFSPIETGFQVAVIDQPAPADHLLAVDLIQAHTRGEGSEGPIP